MRKIFAFILLIGAMNFISGCMLLHAKKPIGGDCGDDEISEGAWDLDQESAGEQPE